MGQYYKPINIDKKEWIYSHHFKNGMKLMEHSYIENPFIEAAEILLTEFGPWHKCKFVWAGDYADVEKETMVKGNKDSGENLFHIVDEEQGIDSIAPVVIDDIKDKHKIDLREFPFIVNHSKKYFVDKIFFGMVYNKRKLSKKYFVDKRKVKEFDGNWKIHPLPLLTCEGNGRGGGDYKSEVNESLIGLWSRDSISIEKEIPKGYKELEVDFRE